MTPQEVLAALAAATHSVPQLAMSAAVAQRESVTEPLLDALRRWVDLISGPDPQWDDGEVLQDYAMYLLAQFREPRAFPLYLRLCRLPADDSEHWIGDILGRDLAGFLAATCHGRVADLQELVADASVYEIGRWEALNALVSLAVRGEYPESELGAWLLRQSEREDRAPSNWFWNLFASAQYDLAQASMQPAVLAAYEEGLVDETIISLDDIATRMEMEPERRRREVRRHEAPVHVAAQAIRWLIEARNRPEPDDDLDEFEEIDPALIPDTYVREAPKIGRNDPCPCGSGKKYKKCCMNAPETGADPYNART